MKTLQNTIAVVALATLLFSSNVFAQDFANASTPVTISLIKGLSMSVEDGSISFTEGVAGRSETISVSAGTASGAMFKVMGHEGRDVTLDFTNTPLSNGVSSLTFEPAVEYTTTSSYSGASTRADNTTVALHNTNGDAYLWVGGSIDVDGSETAGNYTGSFTLSVAY